MISESRLALLARKAVQRAITERNATPAQSAATAHADEIFATGNDGAGNGRLARLARSLRDERRRGRAGHWSYDLNRHLALAQAYEAEKKRLHRHQR